MEPKAYAGESPTSGGTDQEEYYHQQNQDLSLGDTMIARHIQEHIRQEGDTLDHSVLSDRDRLISPNLRVIMESMESAGRRMNPGTA